MEKIRTLLAGKKTYLVLISLVVKAIIEWTADGDIGKLLNSILTACAGITIKAGLNRDK